MAVRVATGQVLWRTNLPAADLNCCVINADTTTVVVDAAGNGPNLSDNGLYALNPQDGTIRWHLPLLVEGKPLVHAGVVYAQVDPQRFSFPSLNAYRASDGTLLWSGRQGAHNGRIELNSSAIFENVPSGLAAFSLRDGHQLWTRAEDGGLVAVTDAAVFIEDAGYTLGALSAKDGSRLWQSSISAGYYSIDPSDVAPVVNGMLYVIGSNGGINSSGGGLAAVRTRDGTVLWQHINMDARGVTVVNGVAYLVTGNGVLDEPGWCVGPCRYWVEARSATTGALLWQTSVPDEPLLAEPVASDYLGG